MTAIITTTAIAAIVLFSMAFVQYAITDIRARHRRIQLRKVRPAFTVIRPAIAPQKSGVLSHLTIRQAKAMVKELGLAEQCRTMTGKSWSRCNRGELLAAIATL